MAENEGHSIKEVSLMIDEEQHVLRYWEREFAFLNPQKNEAGNRIYASKDVAIVKELKRLIRTERKTIQEARIAFLEQFPDGIVKLPILATEISQEQRDLEQIKFELEDLIRTLKQ